VEGKMRIISQGTVQKSQKNTDYQSLAFPGICVMPTGRWIVSYRSAPQKSATANQRTLVVISDDEGKTWTSPIEPFEPPEINGAPGFFRAGYPSYVEENKVVMVLYWVDASNPELPFFNEETEGLLDSEIFFSESHDSGNTWNKPKLMDTSPFNQPTPITGPVMILKNKEYVCHFELNKSYYSKEKWEHSSVVMFSKDKGASWYKHFITSHDPENRFFYWDQRPAVLNDGSILDFFWTYDNKSAKYINIRARKSDINAESWGEIYDTGVAGQPAAPVQLKNGNIVMVFIEREKEPTIKARVSKDLGKTFPRDTEIELYKEEIPTQTNNKGSMQDAWSEMNEFSTGLPATALLPNGDILTVFYSGTQSDNSSIKWVRFSIDT